VGDVTGFRDIVLAHSAETFLIAAEAEIRLGNYSKVFLQNICTSCKIFLLLPNQSTNVKMMEQVMKIQKPGSKKDLGSAEKQKKAVMQKPKSKIALFWEKYPNGIGGEIVNMQAVLK
jgi:hypothetical protein